MSNLKIEDDEMKITRLEMISFELVDVDIGRYYLLNVTSSVNHDVTDRAKAKYIVSI